MPAIGITGKEWKRVTPEEVAEWRRLVVEERKSFREIARMFGREHSTIRNHVPERPDGGALVFRKKGYKKLKKPRTITNVLTYALRMARGRSKKNGRDFDLNVHQMMDMYNGQCGVCALTGLEFDLEKPAKARTGAYTVSIDRIDSSMGYTLDNVRLVCWSVNLSLGQWGEEVFSRIAHAYVARQQEKPE